MKRSHTALAAAAACLALLASGCTKGSSNVATNGSATPEPSGVTGPQTTPAPTQDESGPRPELLIRTLPRNNRPIASGVYFLPVTGPADDLYPAPYHRVRAIVDIPDGYFSNGGDVISDRSADTQPNSDRGTLKISGGITKVHTQPCGGGQLVDPGPTVQDLADALAPHATSTPRPVTVGGSDGLYLEIETPDDPTQCPDGAYSLWDEQNDDMSGTNRMWILDVSGHRVGVVVKTLEGSTHNPHELVHMAQNLLFVTLRAPH